MTVNDTNLPVDHDPRIPVDRSDVTEPGEYYAHIVTGECEVHGITAVRCVHNIGPDGQTKIAAQCLICKVVPN